MVELTYIEIFLGLLLFVTLGLGIALAKSKGFLGKSTKKKLSNGVDQATTGYLETLLTINRAQREEMKRVTGSNSRAKREILRLSGMDEEEPEAQLDLNALRPLLKQYNIPEAVLSIPQVQKFMKNKETMEMITAVLPLLGQLKGTQQANNNEMASTSDPSQFA